MKAQYYACTEWKNIRINNLALLRNKFMQKAGYSIRWHRLYIAMVNTQTHYNLKNWKIVHLKFYNLAESLDNNAD